MTLRVAMIGTGFMGAAHSVGWRQAPHMFDLSVETEMAVVVGRRTDTAQSAASRWGWSESSNDWRSLLTRDDIDIVDIVTPGETHAEIAVAMLDAGKHVLCEKPLANTLEQAETMSEAAARAAARGQRAMVGFTYRRVPAVALMRDLVADGKIGRVQQVRAAYRQDWLVDPAVPLTWRLRRESAGSGALGDIGAHAIDLIQFVTGDQITGVSAVTDTIVQRRPLAHESTMLLGDIAPQFGEVTVDDVALFTVRLSKGALAGVEATRFATGRKNEFTIEVSGDRGALTWNLEDLNTLAFYDGSAPPVTQGFTSILVTEPIHPYLEGWWPPGHVLGYEHGFTHQVKDFVEAIHAGRDAHPTFAEGVGVQRVLAAAQHSAACESRWMPVRH